MLVVRARISRKLEERGIKHEGQWQIHRLFIISVGKSHRMIPLLRLTSGYWMYGMWRCEVRWVCWDRATWSSNGLAKRRSSRQSWKGMLFMVDHINVYQDFVLLHTGIHLAKRYNRLNPETCIIRENLTFRVPCNVIYSYNKSQQDALFLKFILVKNSTCFGQIYCPSSGVLVLYSQQLVFVMLVTLTVC
jgi:hypothetical protein